MEVGLTDGEGVGTYVQRFQQSVLRPVAVPYYGLRKRAVRSEGVSRTVVVA